MTAMAVQVGNGNAEYVPKESIPATVAKLCRLATRPDVVFVAHNSAFDIRALHYQWDMPWPTWEICTKDLACGAWPNQPGGYSLDNLSRCFPFVPSKIEIDLREGMHTPEEVREYVVRDVEACAALYWAAVGRLSDEELRIAAATAHARNLSLVIDRDKGRKAVEAFARRTKEQATEAAKALSVQDAADLQSVFGFDGSEVRSIKPHGVKALLLDRLGFETDTISSKKINPTQLRKNPKAGAVVGSLSKANSALSHTRRVRAFLNDAMVDLNLSYAGSHTFRWTSQTAGKGINFLNLPKHDRHVAPLIRGMLSLSDSLSLVRADAMALEYRMNCWLTGCQHGVALFDSDPFADAYVGFGDAATGHRCDKKDPIRQVWKMTVLGLGFLMYIRTHALNLSRMLAGEAAAAEAKGEKPKISVDDFRDICRRNGWVLHRTPYIDRVLRETGMDTAVLTVAQKTYDLFHAVHPEFRRFADWLEWAVQTLLRNPQADVYRRRTAPDPDRVWIEVDDTLTGRSLRVRCGPWYQPTLVWRDVGVRADRYGEVCLCSVKAGNRGYQKMSPNILIENVVQSAGRNAIADGMLALCDRHRYILNVHDEVLLAVPFTCPDVLRAMLDLVRVYGPGGVVSKKWGWTCLINPDEVNVSRSLWEDDVRGIAPDFWSRIAAGDSGLLAQVS